MTRARALFAAAIFLSAFLVFLVQPLVGKFVLPWFGGAPAVWNTCLLFFQIALLAGYAWAHALAAWLPPRRQAQVHAALLVVSVLGLHLIGMSPPKPDAEPAGALLRLLAVAVGLPYLALAATGPLLQAWYARLWPTASPYPLYALSNAGSLLALIAYPVLVEPWLARRAQAWTWSILYVAAALLVLIAAAIAGQASARARVAAAALPPEDVARRTTFIDRVLWLALPAAASVLLSATTNLLCLDVAVVPFLWIAPLALYLLSYILAFAGPAWYPRWWVIGGLVAAVVEAGWMLHDDQNLGLRLAVAPTVLFLACWACHGEAARRRPAPRHLTGFYLSLAAGGAIGGALVALVAPLVLRWFYEYHAGLFACLAFALGSAFAATPVFARRWTLAVDAIEVLALVGLALVGVGASALRGVRSAERGFHGVLLIDDRLAADGALCRVLRHGSTIHGLQYLDREQRHWPTTYYSAESGAGRALRFLHVPERRVGVIGLGIGTLASYARAGERWTFYEIDRAVETAARRDFTFLADCPAVVDVVIGDARLTLDRQDAQGFDVLLVDAFTSDAIPVHLLTAEAFALYRRHLAKGGVIGVHISNRHLDLRPVVKRQAERLGMHALMITDEHDDNESEYSSDWVLLSANDALLGLEPLASGASHDFGDARVGLWTDEHTALWRVIDWGIGAPASSAVPAPR